MEAPHEEVQVGASETTHEHRLVAMVMDKLADEGDRNLSVESVLERAEDQRDSKC